MNKRERWPDPNNPGQFLGQIHDMGAHVVVASRGAVAAGLGSPVSTVGNMQPIIKGRVLDLKHMTGGKAASKAFSLTGSPSPRKYPPR